MADWNSQIFFLPPVLKSWQGIWNWVITEHLKLICYNQAYQLYNLITILKITVFSTFSYSSIDPLKLSNIKNSSQIKKWGEWSLGTDISFNLVEFLASYFPVWFSSRTKRSEGRSETSKLAVVTGLNITMFIGSQLKKKKVFPKWQIQTIWTSLKEF